MNVYDVEYNVVETGIIGVPHRVVRGPDHMAVLAVSADEAAAFVRAKNSQPGYEVWNGAPNLLVSGVEIVDALGAPAPAPAAAPEEEVEQ